MHISLVYHLRRNTSALKHFQKRGELLLQNQPMQAIVPPLIHIIATVVVRELPRGRGQLQIDVSELPFFVVCFYVFSGFYFQGRTL